MDVPHIFFSNPGMALTIVCPAQPVAFGLYCRGLFILFVRHRQPMRLLFRVTCRSAWTLFPSRFWQLARCPARERVQEANAIF
ncbi:MAG: hypothetical protein CTY16_19800 [Methylobacter sp.]|nr:MAG: hypothetical protein CTY16_19800 [Methylobacter sp.]